MNTVRTLDFTDDMSANERHENWGFEAGTKHHHILFSGDVRKENSKCLLYRYFICFFISSYTLLFHRIPTALLILTHVDLG